METSRLRMSDEKMLGRIYWPKIETSRKVEINNEQLYNFYFLPAIITASIKEDEMGST
jgi:hypothetical protein